MDYARSRATASRLIRRAGKPAVLVRPGEREGPEWDSTIGPETRHDITVVETSNRVRDASGIMVGQSLTTLLVASEGTEPRKTDSVEVNGDLHQIMDVRPLRPGSLVLMWEIDLES